jgi:PBP1b-binding outer membrane lipoprotein LpoB
MKTLKKLSIIVAVGLSTIFFSGCSDYLDVSDDLAAELSMEEVFNNTGMPVASTDIYIPEFRMYQTLL